MFIPVTFALYDVTMPLTMGRVGSYCKFQFGRIVVLFDTCDVSVTSHCTFCPNVVRDFVTAAGVRSLQFSTFFPIAGVWVQNFQQ